MDHIILVRQAYIPNFIPLVPSLHVKKFVVGVLVLSFRPKLNKISTIICSLFLILFCQLCFQLVTWVLDRQTKVHRHNHKCSYTILYNRSVSIENNKILDILWEFHKKTQYFNTPTRYCVQNTTTSEGNRNFILGIKNKHD